MCGSSVFVGETETEDIDRKMWNHKLEAQSSGSIVSGNSPVMTRPPPTSPNPPPFPSLLISSPSVRTWQQNSDQSVGGGEAGSLLHRELRLA